MKLELIRYTSNLDSTGGLLYLNDQFFCFTCEDQFQEKKVHGETCIPAGTYEIKFRNEGGMNEVYKQKYSDHIGMLHLQNVPEFEWIYIHTGNTDDHTEGCILVGYGTEFKDRETTVQRSRDAYRELYKYCRLADQRGEDITITIKDGL